MGIIRTSPDSGIMKGATVAMKLSEYLMLSDAKTIQQLSEESGVSKMTCKNAARGMRLSNYHVAKRISDATRPSRRSEPLVTVDDLCA